MSSSKKIIILCHGEFPSCPVLRTLHFRYKGHLPGWGDKIPQAVWCSMVWCAPPPKVPYLEIIEPYFLNGTASDMHNLMEKETDHMQNLYLNKENEVVANWERDSKDDEIN